MVDPKIWGSAGWYFIQSLQLNFRPELILFYREILGRLAALLPCSICRAGYAKDLKANPLSRITDQASFIAWALAMQNATRRAIKQAPLTSYAIAEPVNHDSIIKFLSIMNTDVVKSKNKGRLDALAKFCNYYVAIIPCLQCRTKLETTATPHTIGQIIGVLKAHKV